MSFFVVDRKRERETDFIDKLIHANVANHYSYDGLGSLHAPVQSKSSYLKNFEVQDWKMKIEIEIFFPLFYFGHSRLAHV
jgi:hypothetical protein